MPNVGHENQPLYTRFASGVVVIGATEAQLTALAGMVGAVTLRAAGANTGTVTLGATGVTSLGGLTLSAGQMVTLYLDQPNSLFAIASGANQRLEYLAQY